MNVQETFMHFLSLKCYVFSMKSEGQMPLGTFNVGVKNRKYGPQCAGSMLPTRAGRILKNACTL